MTSRELRAAQDRCYEDAIASFVTQTKALGQIMRERDAALATIARVKALCDEVADEVTGVQAELVLDILAALAEPTP